MKITKERNSIVIDEHDFHIAHYLPNEYGKCHKLHGHTENFKKIELITEGVVNFTKIKETIDSCDHTLLVPETDLNIWEEVSRRCRDILPCEIVPFYIQGNETTVETIAKYFEKQLLGIPGVVSVRFTLYETKTSGAKRPVEE